MIILSHCKRTTHNSKQPKMVFFVVFALAIAAVAADVSHLANTEVPILRNDFDISPDGSFSYAYETGNGIQAQANGQLVNPQGDNPSLEISGAVSYTAPDGTPVQWSYTAGENGYQAQGPLIPTPPPIPEAILRSLEYIANRPPPVVAPVPRVVLN